MTDKQKIKDELDELLVEKFYFAAPIKQTIWAKDIREASKKYGDLVRAKKIIPPKKLPLIIKIRCKLGWVYWDVREFLKEAKIPSEI